MFAFHHVSEELNVSFHLLVSLIAAFLIFMSVLNEFYGDGLFLFSLLQKDEN